MTYVMLRAYSATDQTPEQIKQISEAAMNTLAPRLASEDGFIRFMTLVLSDGRYGSFSAYSNESAAHRGQEIAVDWVQTHHATAKLNETLEGVVAFSAEGSTPLATPLHGVIRLYQSDATLEDLTKAFDSEGPDIVKAHFTGLCRYTVVKLSDGRVGTFGSFDTQENASKSSQAAIDVRGKSGSAIARVLPTDPTVIEAVLLGVMSKAK